MIKLSIIIPVLNESTNIVALLSTLQGYKGIEIIVIDGGSSDYTPEIAEPYADQVIRVAIKGRAMQMNAGAKLAQGEVLLFLHADTQLPKNFYELIEGALSSGKFYWGRFDVALSGEKFIFRIIERMMNLRSRFSGIATGDQAIFVRRTIFNKIGGFSEIPLMEDVVLSRKLKTISNPVCLRDRVITSSRRWEEKGIWKTILLMWRLRLAFFLGTEPQELVKKYY